MSDRVNRLGRGLEALIPKQAISSGKMIIKIPLEDIKPNPYQPRLLFSESSLKSLSNSIKKFGIAQPILVRKKEGYYELISGERRFRASLLADMVDIPAIVRDISDIESSKLAFVENLEREDLSPLEIAKGYKRLVEEHGITHQEIADLFSKSRSSISNTLRLLQLPGLLQEGLLDHTITEGHARALLALDSESEQLTVYRLVVDQKLSVRQTEALVSERLKNNSFEQPKVQQLSLYSHQADNLSQLLDTRVCFKGQQHTGKIEIFYQSKEQLENILFKIKHS